MEFTLFNVTPTRRERRERESRPRSLNSADATFRWTRTFCRRGPTFARSLALWNTQTQAPAARLDKSGAAGAACGSTQIRERLFTGDCGVLSFTAAHFPSLHHATIEPNPSWNICCEAWAKKISQIKCVRADKHEYDFCFAKVALFSPPHTSFSTVRLRFYIKDKLMKPPFPEHP